ncbi:MAG: LysM peptidoglycan-binding domain-containing protein [Anaerolineales bacterium]|nr:LysM peptidoglycan-binding domain-containing protein [Anaerolineales bacterium]
MAANERRFQTYDLFKLIVAILLLLLLLWLLFQRPAAEPIAAGPTATPTTAPPPASPTPGPATPTVQAEAADGQLQLSGTAAPGSTVQIVIDGQPAGTAAADAAGRWSFTAPAEPGDHAIVVNALDAAGAITASSAPLSLSVAAPIAAPEFGVEVAAGALDITGTGTPGSQIRVTVDGRASEPITVGADGRWSFTAEAVAGEHTIAADALDAAGQVAASAPPLKIAAPAPLAAPTLDLPAGPLTAGSLALQGSGAPGSTVQIVIDGQPAGTARVGPDGRWSFDATLTAGEHTLTANALDDAGQVAAAGEPAALSVGDAPATAAAPTLDTPAPPVRAGRVRLTGTGTPGSTVQVMIDGQPAGTATVGADGRWSFDATLTAGGREIGVNTLDAAGQVAAAGAKTTLTVGAAAAATPAPSSASACRPGDPEAYGEDRGEVWLVDRCDNLSYIARQTGIDLNALIAANPQVLDPDLIYPGQVITLPGR